MISLFCDCLLVIFSDKAVVLTRFLVRTSGYVVPSQHSSLQTFRRLQFSLDEFAILRFLAFLDMEDVFEKAVLGNLLKPFTCCYLS